RHAGATGDRLARPTGEGWRRVLGRPCRRSHLPLDQPVEPTRAAARPGGAARHFGGPATGTDAARSAALRGTGDRARPAPPPRPGTWWGRRVCRRPPRATPPPNAPHPT